MPQSMAKRTKFSREEELRIVEMFQGDGFTTAEISELLDIGKGAVLRVLRRYGIPVSRGRPNLMDTLTVEQLDGIVADYGNLSYTVREILVKWHLSYESLYGILEELGVPSRTILKVKGSVMNPLKDRAVEMFQAGATLVQIKAETGIESNSLRVVLQRRGIPSRMEQKYLKMMEIRKRMGLPPLGRRGKDGTDEHGEK